MVQVVSGNSKSAPAVWFPAIRSNSGADSFTVRLVAALKERGVKATITWLPLRAEYAPWSVSPPKPPENTDIVHTNSWLPDIFIPHGVKIVSTIHLCVHDESLAPYKSYWQRKYHENWIRRQEHRMLMRADSIVAVSQYTKTKTLEAHHIPKPIQVIYNGICTKTFTPPTGSKKLQKIFKLLYVGNLSRRKGADLLRTIMAELGDSFLLYVASSRPTDSDVWKFPPNVKCVGHIDRMDDLIALYHSADALLFPSRVEGLPLAVLEASACGLPIVASRSSSLPECVKHEETGLLCRGNNGSDFTANIRRLAEMPDQGLAFGMRGRAMVVRRFSFDDMVQRYIEIYGSAVH